MFLEGSGATSNVVLGDYIDADVTGTAYVAGTTNFYLPSGAGIVLETADANTIGGTQAGAGNVIGGGVDLLLGANGNVIEGNMIGTNASGTERLAGWTGIDIATVGTLNFRDDSQYNTIGGSTAAARNLIGGGVVLDSTALFDVVEGNYIGTDVTGTTALYAYSGSAGMMVSGQFDFIGGDSPGEGNLISGFAYGVEINGGNYIQVQGNLIGTDVTGTHALGNSIWGVEVDGGSNNTIGGSTPGAGNLVSGNHAGIDAGGSETVIEGNLVGTDITGTLTLGNVGDGLDVYGSGDSIGGTTPGSGNVISANGGYGIYIAGSGVSVEGNMIGTDVSGTLPLGNASDGVNIQTENNQIGGPMPGAGNVIAANGGNGVSIVVPVLSDTAPGNVVQGNDIGTNSSGSKNLGNAGDGVYIMGSSYFPGDQTIGGTAAGAGNVIAYNGGPGVSSDSGPGGSINGNDIFNDGGLGIVVGINGVLSTYAEAQGVALPYPAPVLTSAVFDPQGTVVEGSITGTPFTQYQIDFFASGAVNPSGFGDGQTYLESIGVYLDDSGSAQFQMPLDDAVPVGQWITATATDSTGTTSQFSLAIPVVSSAPGDAVGFSAAAYLVTETGGAAVVTVNRVGSTAGTLTVDYATVDGSALAGTNYTAESGPLTFAAGQQSQTITIPIQDDGVATPDLSFQIVLSNPTGASLGSVTDAVVTIADAESAGVLSFSTAGETALESQEPAPLVVTRTGSSLGEVTVDYRVTGGTANPQESPDEQGNNYNYIDTYGTLTFQAGQTTATIPITTIDIYQSAILPAAPVFGDPLTIDVTLGDPTGGAILGANTTSVITIVGPDDANGGFGVEELNSNAHGGGVEMEVYRTGSVAGLESVQYATSDGTGTAGVNYAATSGTLTFEPGDDEKFITISVAASRSRTVRNRPSISRSAIRPVGRSSTRVTTR